MIAGLMVTAVSSVGVGPIKGHSLLGPRAAGAVTQSNGDVFVLDQQSNPSAENVGRGMAFDSAGNLYYVDQNGNQVLKRDHSTGSISLEAGNGTAGYSGDGGAATSAELNYAWGLTVASGVLYIADSLNSVVRAVSLSTGVITTAFASTSGYPASIDTDGGGNLYFTTYAIAGTGSATVEKRVISGGATTILLSGGALSSTDATAPSLRYAAGQLYITGGDRSAGTVRMARYNLATSTTTFLTAAINSIPGANCSEGYTGPQLQNGSPASRTGFCQYTGAPAVDEFGDVYIEESDNADSPTGIIRIDPAGTLTQLMGAGSSFTTGSLATTESDAYPSSDLVYANGNLYFQYSGGEYLIAGVNAPWGQPLSAGERQSLSELDFCEACQGKPVDTYTGAFLHTFNDLSIPGRGVPLSLSHSYSSSNAPTVGPLGSGWTFNYNMSLSFNASAGTATVFEENGSSVVFNQSGTTFTPSSPRILATLTQSGTASGATYTFTREQTQVFTFNSSGQLTGLQDLNGYTTAVTYPSSSQMVVTEPGGRTLTFALSGGKVTSVTDPIGRTVTFAYGSSAGAGGNGNYLTSVTDVRGQTTSFCYDVSGSSCYSNGSTLLRVMTDPRGNSVTNVYDTSGRVTSQTDRAGGVTTFAYAQSADSACPVSGTTVTKITSPAATDPAGNVTLDSYLNGELVCETKGAGTSDAATWQYGYDPVTLARTWTKDPNGHLTANGYDYNGNLTSNVDADGNTQTWTYNQYNEPTTYDDANYNATTNPDTTTYTYGAATTPATPGWLLTSQSRPKINLTTHAVDATATTSYTYNTAYVSGSSGPQVLDLSSMTDARGNTTTYHYDGTSGTNYGYRTSTVDPAGDTTTVTYDLIGRPTSTVTPNGNKSGGTPATYRSATVYDPAGNALASINPLGSPVADSFGRAASSSSLGSADTSQTWTATAGTWGITAGGAYLASGGSTNLATQTGAANGTVAFTESTVQAGLGITFRGDGTTSNYWALRASPSTSTWILTKTVSGTTTTVTPTGTPVCCAANQWVSVSFSGSTITLSINGVVKATATDSALSTNTQVGLYSQGTGSGVIGGFMFAASGAGATAMGYDADGNKAWQQDADGNTTSYTYDGENRQTVTTRADGTTVKTDFYGDGSMKDQVDGAGASTVYTYDHLDQLTSVTDPDNRTTSYHYDGAGNLVTLTDPAGQITTDTYDPANRLTNTTYTNPASGTASTPNVAYTYDGNGNRLTMVDGTGKNCYVWDSLNEMRSYTNGGGSTSTCNGDTSNYDYNLDNQVTAITYPGQTTTVINDYDSVGRMDWVSDFAGNKTYFAYDNNSNLSSETLPTTGTTVGVAYNYNPADQLTTTGTTKAIVATQGATTLASFDYSRDPNAQIKSQTAVTSGTTTQNDTYSYSALNQLTTVDGYTTYAYDHADNLTQLLSGNTISYDAANQSQHQKTSGGTSVADYSDNTQGDRTAMTPYVSGVAQTAWAYTYDQANQLHSTVHGATTISWYLYDGDGLRREKDQYTVNTWFDYNPTATVPQLLRAGAQSGTGGGLNSNWTYYLYGPDHQPFEQTNTTITNGGTPSTTTNYLIHDNLGNTRVLTDTTGTVDGTYTYNPYGNTTAHTGTASTQLQYADTYNDTEAAFNYTQHRYYDPATAQFLTRDPLEAATRSPYSYASGNPLNAIDRAGLWPSLTQVMETTALVTGVIGVTIATGGADLVIAGAAEASIAGFGLDTLASAVSVGISAGVTYSDCRNDVDVQCAVDGLATATGFLGAGLGVAGEGDFFNTGDFAPNLANSVTGEMSGTLGDAMGVFGDWFLGLYSLGLGAKDLLPGSCSTPGS